MLSYKTLQVLERSSTSKTSDPTRYYIHATIPCICLRLQNYTITDVHLLVRSVPRIFFKFVFFFLRQIQKYLISTFLIGCELSNEKARCEWVSSWTLDVSEITIRFSFIVLFHLSQTIAVSLYFISYLITILFWLWFQFVV